MNGILIVNKPKGITSHDVVDRVRKAARTRRVGHAGTLDPLATGVLVVCIGQGTRVAEYLTASRKTYNAEVTFGVATNTYDAEGDVVREQDVDIDRERIEAALACFKGEIDQTAPVYSAIKKNGQPLHRLARKGIDVKPPTRRVTIHRVEITNWSTPKLTLQVECSAGTYIRSIAHDLGEALGCGAHLSALERTASGSCALEEAVTLDEMDDAESSGELERNLLPLDAALQAFPALELSDAATRTVLNGGFLAREATPATQDAISAELCRAHNAQGELIALIAFDAEKDIWRPRKVFG